MNTTPNPTVCIIGAGPYGVAIAAHLQFIGINFRIFGYSMHRWMYQMPKNMFLKSEGCASSISDPTGHHTLARYCSNEGLPFSEYGMPVSRGVFTRYALSFQQKLVPNVEDVMVTAISKLRDGFELRLNTGETLDAGKVIVATGMDYMAYIPEQLARLPVELRSHSADCHDLSGFKGAEVVVVGGGQSALETAAMLREEGASVSLFVRKTGLEWNPVPSKVRRSIYYRFRNPRTRLGDGLQLWVYDKVPGIFHYFPQRVRLAKVGTVLGPAGAWWLKDRVVGRLPILLGHHLCGAEVRGGRVALQVTDQKEQHLDIFADHVVAGTGYRFNIQNLPFLSQSLKSQLRQEQQSPLLSSNFESNVPGLYFAGLSSANSFGPAMRFLVGASFTARRIASHLARGQRSRALPFAQSEKCPEL